MDKERKRCKNGEHKNPKTGECVKMSEETRKNIQMRRKQHRITRRNSSSAVAPIVATVVEPAVEPAVEPVSAQAAEPVVEPVAAQAEEPVAEPVVEPVAAQAEEPVEKAVEPVAAQAVEPVEPVAAQAVEPVEPEEETEEEKQDAINDLYPTLDDPQFSSKIAQRQEFADTKYDGDIHDIREQANKLCNANFELMPHQLFVRNFLSFQTPYNSLLLYHGLGSGKTCSAIGIAEEMRHYMKQMGITKRIIIVASPNVQDNFRLQLFDERRLEQLPNGTWNLNTCIGNTLLQEINPTNLIGLTRERIISQIRSLINTFYVFMGNKGEFANYITKAISIPSDAGYSPAEMTALRDQKIKAHFNNRLVILDEIHNIRISDANKTKLTSVLLNEIAKKSDNMRLLLLSATPMYNSYNEIIWLVNLLNANDNRSSIKIEDVFQKDGSWVEEQIDADGKVTKENGRDLLTRKLTGYISYVRGENPYIFPYRIYPATFSPEHTFVPSQYPSVQMNQQPIMEPLQFIPVYKNEIGEYQAKGYQFILHYLGLKSTTITDKYGKERAMPSFENMESFGYTLLLPPLESLIMVYPNAVVDKFDEQTEYEQKDAIKMMIGKHGLAAMMKYTRVEKPVPKRIDYEYQPKMRKTYGPIFSPEIISRYSAKIGNICKIIKRPSTGIILIYSQYIDGGLVPMALALESMGFSRYASTPEHNRNLFKTPQCEPIDSLTMQPRSKTNDSAKGKPAKYVMITGEKDFSQNNNEDIKYITNKENAEGQNVKVILISMAASEGLDFKNIRQVHVLEPWYNMNRIEQIIGRGVRNLSHCNLPFEDRNVEIYLHGTSLNKDEEAADMYVYRSAEKKAIQIGRVTRLLKETAVDCHLNLGQTNFTEAKLLENAANQDIRIRLSSGAVVPFQIGDKPRTDICDYMEDCNFTCSSNSPVLVSQSTYHENFIKNNSTIIMKKIRDLFLEKTVYQRDHLITAITLVKKYPIEHIYYALTQFVNNKNETLMDKYGRTGYLVSRGNFYAFQPNEIMDETISTFERSVPVDYKPVSLRMEVAKEISAEPTAEPEPPAVQGFDTIIKKMRDIANLLAQKDLKIKATDKNWYKHANQVVNELLTVHEMPGELIHKYVLFHFLDTLSAAEKLELVTNINTNDAANGDNGYATILKLYFDDLMLVDEEGNRAIILADGEMNQLFVTNANEWVPAKFTDINAFSNARKARCIIPKASINRTDIGFMHPFKQKEIVFKTKDMTQKRNNKGAYCADSSKPMIAAKIGAILNEPALYQSTTIERPELCILLEILMRWLTEKTGVVYFFRPEQVNEMDVTNMKL